MSHHAPLSSVLELTFNLLSIEDSSTKAKRPISSEKAKMVSFAACLCKSMQAEVAQLAKLKFSSKKIRNGIFAHNMKI